jgi:hypothetical protein
LIPQSPSKGLNPSGSPFIYGEPSISKKEKELLILVVKMAEAVTLQESLKHTSSNARMRPEEEKLPNYG